MLSGLRRLSSNLSSSSHPSGWRISQTSPKVTRIEPQLEQERRTDNSSRNYSLEYSFMSMIICLSFTLITRCSIMTLIQIFRTVCGLLALDANLLQHYALREHARLRRWWTLLSKRLVNRFICFEQSPAFECRKESKVDSFQFGQSQGLIVLVPFRLGNRLWMLYNRHGLIAFLILIHNSVSVVASSMVLGSFFTSCMSPWPGFRSHFKLSLLSYQSIGSHVCLF